MRLVLTSDNHWGHTERGNWANQIMLEEIRETVPEPFTLIIAGDLGNHERWHREEFLRTVRKQLPGIIIGGVTGNHDCLSDDTQCLTRRGWLNYDQIQDNDQIFSFNLNSGHGEWHPILNRIVKQSPEKMNVLQGKTISMSVTDNHRVLWKGAHSKTNWKYTNISQLPSSGVKFKTGATEGNSDFPISDALLQACAWFLTDGSIVRKKPNHTGSYYIWQSKPIEGILNILDQSGLKYTVAERQRDITEIAGKKLLKAPLSEKRISLDGKSAKAMSAILPNKEIPDWIMNNLSDRQFTLFEREVVLANGSANKAYPRSYALYGTQEMLEQFQRLMVQHSRRANLRQDTRGHFLLRVNVKDYTEVNPKDCTSVVSYTGSFVWCLTVPLTNFMVRRNGSPFFTGNCWSWTKAPHFTVKDLIAENESFFKQTSVNYLPKEPIQDESVYVCGFNGWYHDIYATKETAIPHLGDPLDGRRWLSSFAHREFGRCLTEMKEAKARGQKTVLVTHMGFTEEAANQDWKTLMAQKQGFNPYFGGNPKFEDMLDDCDVLLYGHSHVKYDGLAKNGKTRVINAGSDYNEPRYQIIEV